MKDTISNPVFDTILTINSIKTKQKNKSDIFEI